MMSLRITIVLLGLWCGSGRVVLAEPLEPATTASGYLARLLINESPFPGERGWVSEVDSRAAMLAILYVLDSRLCHVPAGYTQAQVAAVRTTNVLELVTAGGERGQCDGFYRGEDGQYLAAPRVLQRIERLTLISLQGEPGRFVRLLDYGQGLARAYIKGGIAEADRFAGLTAVGRIQVTGRAYAWMTDQDCYHPGGSFVRISDEQDGSLGGNRFFTLKRMAP